MTDIPVRRISFDEAIKTVPKHFARDNDIVLSHIAVALSSVFPDGEDFFVRSVRHYRNDIADPVLKAQVAGFIGQESIHGREHRVLNERFAELGYPTKVVERVTRKGLALRSKYAPAVANLAMTAALEHFTATLAEMILSDPEARGMFGDDTVMNLFLWHALEESEHKAVAFDVYRLVDGSERLRTFTMTGLRYGFPIAIAGQVLVGLLLDKEARRHPVRVWKSLRRVRKSPLMSRKLWNQLKDFNRRDFHPNQSEHTGLVEPWREELFGKNGTLNDKLAGAAA
jgi:predicted metal-dependent hydrolase